MKRILILLSLGALCVSVGSAGAAKPDGKGAKRSGQGVEVDASRAIGYARAIGGPGGLSFQYGTGNLIVEGILGLKVKSFSDDSDKGPPRTFIDFAIGGHFQMLLAQSASLTVGGRVNLGLGKTDTKEPTDVIQWGADIPMRVYWWPTKSKHISIHSEFGISILFGPEEGVLYGNGEVEEKGETVRIFNGFGDSAFGHLGLSFWW